ncbi:MAG: hypothetical protein VYE22_36715 [Myxococcota bacterium]|nr:hypothetical protein [Myxococcota bacterium]
MTDDREEEDRKAILARRSKLIALALGGLTSATGCYESHAVGMAPTRPDAEAPRRDAEPGPCLGAPIDAGPRPCLDAPIDAGPGPCLSAPIDAGPPPEDAAVADGGVAPTPCLTMPPPDPE